MGLDDPPSLFRVSRSQGSDKIGVMLHARPRHGPRVLRFEDRSNKQGPDGPPNLDQRSVLRGFEERPMELNVLCTDGFGGCSTLDQPLMLLR
jgi:hypothetical protein